MDDKKADFECSLNKSTNACRCQPHSEPNLDDDCEADRHSLKQHLEEMSLYKSDTEEDSPEFDPVSTNAFDQL